VQKLLSVFWFYVVFGDGGDVCCPCGLGRLCSLCRISRLHSGSCFGLGLCVCFFWPSKPMKMPQLVTGTSMPFSPPLRLLPMLASNQSTLTKSPRVKPLTCLTTSFIQHQQKKTRT
jgi:hypothetical protein